MIKKISILFILLTSLHMAGLKAQAVLPPLEASINLELKTVVTISDSALNTSFDPMALLSAADSFLVSTSLLVPDTNVISKIHIKLGTTLGGHDLINQEFIYDATNLVAPQVYHREANSIKICFGTYANTSVFYCEIKLEDHSGNFSTITNCQSDQ